MFNLLHKKILARIQQMKYNTETGHLYIQNQAAGMSTQPQITYF